MKLDATDTLLFHIKAERLPKPALEFRFHKTRRWRFDIAWPAFLIAAEIDGGSWIAGRHNTGSGFAKDLEKFNTAAEMSWSVFRFTPEMVYNGTAIRLLKRVLT